ncbi:MAG: uracil-DNA glycosylase [Chloroflexia bacterium]|nr:uracil-DNA glycosylase [Chloroflexia bacterium]
MGASPDDAASTPTLAECLDAPAAGDARQRLLDVLQEEMRGCQRCVGAGFVSVARPVFRGNARQRVMVVGQAPAPFMAERPAPFSGASGKVLRSWFARAGVAPETFDERVYLTSLTKCFPGKSASGKGDRAPSTAEISLCRNHLEREVALVRPAVLVTLGRVAATAFVGRDPLAALVGTRHQVEVADQRLVVIPLPHPSGVSHWLNDAAHRSLVERGLELLADEVRRLA